MKLSSLVFLGCVLSLTTSNVSLAARDNNPCDANGELKGWAKKQYDPSVCAPVTSNSAPTVQITAPGDQAEFADGQLIGFHAAATDVEDGDLSASVIWTSSLDGSIAANTTLSPGNHIITASVSDSGNLSATDSVSVTVSAPPATNTAPTVSIDAPLSGTTVEEGTALLLKGFADDAEDGDLSNSITWCSSVDGAIGNFTTLSVGDHLITATVTDSNGASSSDTINLSVFESTAPQTYSLAVTWSAPEQRADGSQLAAQELAGYRINWNNDTNGESGSLLVQDGTATSYQIDNLNAGSYRLSLNTIDINGLVSSNSTDMVVELN